MLQKGVDYALEGIPGKLPFLKGLSQVCSRLPAAQADLLLNHIQNVLAEGIDQPEETDHAWEDYFDFMAVAQERASKGAQPRSALKGVSWGIAVGCILASNCVNICFLGPGYAIASHRHVASEAHVCVVAVQAAPD